VAFIARKLSGGEPRYSTTEKEAGAFVFALRKWRHLLDGETFEAVTDHLALRWLMNLRLPHFHLARWIVDIQMKDFTVLHAAGDGELMAVPDPLSRDFVDGQVICDRCLEVVAEMDDEQAVESEVEAMRCSQETEFGNDLGKYARERGYLVSDERLLCRMRKDHVQFVVPKAMVERVLQRVRG
jgi:RNase H-like domain found in reverse transcriptase